MLAQDMLTGYVHEVPDTYAGYEGFQGIDEAPEVAGFHGYGFGENPPPDAYGEVVFDGLGNPVGFLPIAAALPALAPFAKKLLPKALPFARRAMPFLRRAGFPGAAGALGPMAAGALRPGFPGLPLPFRPPIPGALRRFMPGRFARRFRRFF